MSLKSTLSLSILVLLTGCASANSEDASASGAALEAALGPLPAGTFHGTGDYQGSARKNGPYAVTYVIEPTSLDVTYTWGPNPSDGSHLVYRLTWTNATEFTFTFDGEDVQGTGYCVPNGCHFATPANAPFSYETTITMHDGSLESIGAMTYSDRHDYWSDTLQTVN